MSLEDKLPRMYSCVHIPDRDPGECAMCHADLMSGGSSSGMYTPGKPIGDCGSNFVVSPANVRKEFDLGIVDPVATDFSLQERYDFSDHNTPNLKITPHLNQSVVDVTKLNRYDDPHKVYTGTTSNKIKNKDGFKGLGEAHSTMLFPQFKPWKD